MIVIVSNKRDRSTQKVIQWLNYYKVENVLLDNSSFVEQFSFNLTSEGISYFIKGTDKISSIWFRREDGSFRSWELGDNVSEENLKFHRNNIKNELKKLKAGIYEYLRTTVPSLGNYSSSDLNKITQLIKAREVGLQIPNSSILNSKERLDKTIATFGSLITKPIHETISWATDRNIYTSYTEVIEQTDEVDEQFFPSLVQSLIEKEFEIRSFYLDGKFYSMAIFSQDDDQTKIDFRRYNTENGNRTIPYKLDDDIKYKLIQVFEYFDLNTGSVDLIKSTDGEIYFLEINPVGQYGMVSLPCNYNLDKEIAEFLIQ